MSPFCDNRAHQPAVSIPRIGDKIEDRRRLIVTTMEHAMRRFFRLLRPLLVLAAIITWVSGHAQQAHSADAAPKFPIEIPMRIEGGMFAIELTVNGKGPFLFAIDTGAEGGPRLDSSLMEKLGLKSSGQMREAIHRAGVRRWRRP